MNQLFNDITAGYETRQSPTLQSNGEYLHWCDYLGIGYLKSHATDDEVYDIDYWEKYQRMTDTQMGYDLTQARYDLVKKYTNPNQVLDVGIGSGQFVKAADCFGFDVNQHAIAWLKSQNRYAHYNDDYSWNITMWDVLEHIDNPTEVLSRVDEYFIMSTPVYMNMEQCLTSKHFRINEHIWYFTTTGCIEFMRYFGFKCLEISSIETKLGREAIESFVFKRSE